MVKLCYLQVTVVVSCPGGSIIIRLSPASDFCTPAAEEILTTLRRMRSASRAVRSERVVTDSLFIEGAALGLTLRGMTGERVVTDNLFIEGAALGLTLRGMTGERVVTDSLFIEGTALGLTLRGTTGEFWICRL